ncbi:MAG: bifunctional diaminohydroxyphosphoribosylaminopyrimidine deaminase/5-amino-6-(5-phosphoribosylamino)uracil reductase RibD [candidate division WOR-3 bacterium]|jgi:diaminohydroxyphosphoribosylaminopyrimidine deaminase/5-amino-6-(5-phosphoribosylamino)uracil reductase
MPKWNTADRQFMLEALELAFRGCGLVSPNPMVGAVLVKNGKIVGRGYHRRFGAAHAEVEAIRDAGKNARGATLYVTMEPCCFEGKTPACTAAIINAGISRVITAMLDPNPRVNGNGVKCLRRQGIQVEVGLLEDQARRLNEAYITFMSEHRPFVILKVAATIDGMMATGEGESRWITGERARAAGQLLRLMSDAVLVGVNTVLNDNPLLTCRLTPEKKLLRVILDSSLRLPDDSRLLDEPGPVLVFTASRQTDKIRRIEKAGAQVIRVRQERKGRLNWQDIMNELYHRQVTSVLIEGGATVVASALEAGVVDKAYFFQAPKVLGPGKLFSAGIKPRTPETALTLRDVRHIELGDDLLTEGYVYRFG